MSRQELADACNAELAKTRVKVGSGPRWAGLTEKTIGAMERGEIRWPNKDYRQVLCAVLKADERTLGLYIDRPVDAGADTFFSASSPDLEHDVRRREFLPIAAATVGASLLTELAGVLLGNLVEPQSAHPPSAERLLRQASKAKRLYQACDYTQLAAFLAPLLSDLATAQQEVDKSQLAKIHEIGAATYHVVASLLLKHGEHPLALLAAERSAQSARASSNPITIAASARIMAHSLASNGHTSHAVSVAQQAAQQLDSDDGLTSPDATSVYGALVLRAAVAAARLNDRETASTLLDEGQRAARRLGDDGNHQWTGFGPQNVLLHRVNIALTLGDAGTAIAIARKVSLDRVPLTERKVSLHLDVAQAYTQWGRHPQALSALRAAYSLAPQEVRTRPAARRVVSDLATLSRGSDRSDAMRFATAAGLAL
ncbi:tetratricopeptide (TPR) repeat protein [Hamadaea flava]|uniref:Transcriptional regulator n=1 Tax=Hamadaea flava TaxID=1742688 RepID=A0ABV8LIS5_9ACTN|nr:hypothetical protein [Hamadaea flava]MCP2325220.1 tetratricopeptide (TPR) repeat protein [Hamadaea flava]